MSPWQQRMARDREEILFACGEHDRAIDNTPEPRPPKHMYVNRRIVIDPEARLPPGTFAEIVRDFVDRKAVRFTVDIGPDTRRMTNTRLCILRAAEKLGANISVRQKRGLVYIERAK